MTDENFVLIGDLRTMDPARPRAEAMAVSGGRILAVGSRDEALAALPPCAPVKSAPGVVTPEFIDSHVHTLIAGLELRRLDVSDATSVAELWSESALSWAESRTASGLSLRPTCKPRS